MLCKLHFYVIFLFDYIKKMTRTSQLVAGIIFMFLLVSSRLTKQSAALGGFFITSSKAVCILFPNVN